MISKNEAVLRDANKALAIGNYEQFLSHCTDDTSWNFVGDQTLHGKESVRTYMNENYIEPPIFDVENMISQDEFVIAIGKIQLKNSQGQSQEYAYCDVWEFSNGKMCKLKAFVI
ncbi:MULTISPECIES: nuclear transport factor 2 family protein [Sphingobacterium]|uniref:Nuclear transport factor 2 family protein n=1 Tax=Sphingobacterium populi TaxID=1812824 RepID=A0ABW5UC90_9SPHI|nr:nuclear transport factor 2 family protein [Sphingobacterium sp. CFCC 11742]